MGASEGAGPKRWVDCEIPHQLERGMGASEDAGLAGPERWVDCEIPHRLKRGTKRQKRGQYRLTVNLRCYIYK